MENGDPIPEWIAEARTEVLDELRLFFQGLVGCTLAPRRFMREWRAGGRKTLNPFAFLGMSLTVAAVFSWVIGSPQAESRPWLDVLEFASPYATVLAGAALSHLCFRAGGTAVPFRGTLAAAMFVSGGPLTGLMIPLQLFSKLLGPGTGAGALLSAAAHGVLIVAAAGAFLAYSALTLQGLHHEVKSRWTSLAVLVQGVFLVGVVGVLLAVTPR